MKITHFVFLVVLFLIIFDVSKFFYYRYQADIKNLQPEKKVFGDNPNFKYMAAGDSVAVGVGADTLEDTFTYIIGENISKNQNLIYKNIAVSGAKTGDLIDNQIAQIVDINPDVVVISIGANDITHLVRSKDIIENYKKIKERLLNETGAIIYISNIADLSNAKVLPLWYRYMIDRKAEIVNADLMKLNSERFNIINIHDNIPYNRKDFAEDYFHPSNRGHQNWASAYMNAISK